MGANRKYRIANQRCGHSLVGVQPHISTELRRMPDGGVTILRKDLASGDIRSSVILFPSQLEILRAFLEQPSELMMSC